MLADRPLLLCFSCGADFHRQCINMADMTSNSCPMCKDAFFENPPELPEPDTGRRWNLHWNLVGARDLGDYRNFVLIWLALPFLVGVMIHDIGVSYVTGTYAVSVGIALAIRLYNGPFATFGEESNLEYDQRRRRREDYW